ncbi:MAG: response regulator [Bacteroidales bacterium]|nr:response regulator [Bacteroidales bacterium]
MLNSLRYRLLAWLLAFVVLTVLLIIPANIIHAKKEKKINQVAFSINTLYINFLKDFKTINDFLFVEPVNANFFLTGESPYLNSHISISNLIDDELLEIKSTQQIRHFEIEGDLGILSENLQQYNHFFDSLVYLVYKRGYEDYGLEGELYTYGTLLENESGIDQSKVIEIRRIEQDYLLKDEPGIVDAFYNLLPDLRNSVLANQNLTAREMSQSIDLINGYLSAFDRIVKLDAQAGIRKNIALKAELNKLGGQIEVLLQGIIEKSGMVQKALISALNIYYALFLAFIISLIVFLSYILSKRLVYQLESLTRYISGLKKDRLADVPPFKLRNPTYEIGQIYREFRNLISQLIIGGKQRDKALQNAENSLKRYQDLADMLPQSIFETDSWGNYTYVNKAWYDHFGYAEEDLLEGLNLIETLISESKDNDIMGINKIENLNFIAIRKNGTQFPASVYSDNIIINGTVVGRRGLIVDITDKIRYIDTLEKETTKAKTSDELKSSFLANMSHEIRTPINSIIGFSNLLALEQIPDLQKKDFVNYIRSSSEILINLVDDILDIAKIEAGELKISKKECELRTLGEELLKTSEEAKKKYNKGQLKLIFKPEKSMDKMLLKTDPFRLRQIFTNLINNAIKFTEEGYVEFGYRLKDERTVEFYVKDTGVGLSRNELDLIFERFKRSSHSENRNIAGTGLGLAISKNLVQLLGGEMWVDSEPGEGTVFFFTLPYLRTARVEDRKVEIYPAEKNYDWTGKRILITEDDPSSFNFLKELLRKTNVEILHAGSGLEAVEICRSEEKIDLVVMDIRLPEMNGIEATQQIKKIKGDLPVIAHTAFAMAGDKDRIKESGCDDYIAKPTDIKQFMSVVNYYLKHEIRTISTQSDMSSEMTKTHSHLNSPYSDN